MEKIKIIYNSSNDSNKNEEMINKKYIETNNEVHLIDIPIIKKWTIKQLWSNKNYKKGIKNLLSTIMNIKNINFEKIMNMDDISIYQKLHNYYILSDNKQNLIKNKVEENKKLAQKKFEFIKNYIPIPDNAQILDIGTMDYIYN